MGEKKKYQKIDDNGELVIEWKKEKSIKDVVVENICYACPCCYRWIYCIRAGQAKRKITSRLLEDYK